MELFNTAAMILLIFLATFAIDMAMHELSHMAACTMLNHCAFATNALRKMRIIVGAGSAVDMLLATAYVVGCFISGNTAVKYGLGIATLAVTISLMYNL